MLVLANEGGSFLVLPVDWKRREGGFPRRADLVSKIRDWQLGRQRVTVAQKPWVWMQADRTSRWAGGGHS